MFQRFQPLIETAMFGLCSLQTNLKGKFVSAFAKIFFGCLLCLVSTQQSACFQYTNANSPNHMCICNSADCPRIWPISGPALTSMGGGPLISGFVPLVLSKCYLVISTQF